MRNCDNLRAGLRFIRLIALDARVAPGNSSRSSRGIGKGLDQIPVRPSQKSGFLRSDPPTLTVGVRFIFFQVPIRCVPRLDRVGNMLKHSFVLTSWRSVKRKPTNDDCG
jgi:hypothetical protein